MPWCCIAGVDSSKCAWKAPDSYCYSSDQCPNGMINMGVSKKGEGKDWVFLNIFNGIGSRSQSRAWCCPPGEMGSVSFRDVKVALGCFYSRAELTSRAVQEESTGSIQASLF